MSNNDYSDDEDNVSLLNKELNKLIKYNDYALDENVFKFIKKIKLINDFYNNQSNIEEVLKDCPDMIFFVKEQTEELCKIAVSNYGLSLQYVKNQTNDICKLAILNNVYSFNYIQNKTYDLCKYAIQQNIEIFRCVNKKLQTTELCMLSLIYNNKISYDPFNIQYVREDLLTYDLWKIALKNNGLSLKFMELDYQTYELCLLAVKNKPKKCRETLLLKIKSEFHTNELIDIELKTYSFNKQFIKNPTYLIDKKISDKIIKKEIGNCAICHEIKKYYFQYECGHLSCFECKLKQCYYNCNDKHIIKKSNMYNTDQNININIIYINTDFKE